MILALTMTSHSPPPLMGSQDGTQRALGVTQNGVAACGGGWPTTLPCISPTQFWNVLSDKVPEAEYLLITGALTVTAMKNTKLCHIFSGCSSHRHQGELGHGPAGDSAKGMRW